MAGDVTAEPDRRKGMLPAWMVSKGGLAAIAGGTLLLACCGAYAALRGDGEAPPAVTEEKVEIPVPMPVASKPQAIKADAYSIVSVFEGEAFLATPNDLVRVVVGAVVPGLGTITSVETFPNGGGTVAGTEAVLRTR
ncbi:MULTISPECIES: hypothetical protein [Aureimonas]|uniref:Uncharacterized protein n=2 Tax=Aureimonas TaxID=414371 RepID=A0A1H0HDK8_9HYPH|nr:MULTISPECIES: hypothetical protein [Aureimonas]MBB3934648.1 hypothetical protein [Aureimonas phyllosphaerae]MBB3950541.1 hypothetical protein [Aureimonas jatrophae]MBB3958136.1 hypothetical protein [Aureimonas phyllosphaerae]SDO17299.1 hypothetical protein SAMN05192530_10450 [Aureimonas jatrophae]SFE92402.1 hypothetical protein SAMN05216566_101107 [Aureimonas phyllosphaerae]